MRWRRPTAAIAALCCLGGYAAVRADGGGKQDIGPLDRAEALLVAERPRAARAILADAIRNDPASARAHLLQTRAWLAIGNGIAAEAEVARARSAGTPGRATRHLMAEAYLLQGQPARALDEADAEQVAPAFAARAARVRGLAQQAIGDLAAADAELARAARLAPMDAANWIAISRLRATTGDTAAANVAAARAAAIAPRLPSALTLRGEAVRRQYGLTASLPWFDRALAVDPENVPALIEKAATLGDLGRTRAMLATTRAALRIDGGNPRAFLLQAVLAARAGEYGLAKSLMCRTNGKLGDMPAAALIDGIVALQDGNVEQAIDRFDTLLTLQPDNRKARRLMALAQWRGADHAGAIETLGPIVDLPQADVWSLTLAARAAEAMGDREAAADWLDRAAAPVAAPIEMAVDDAAIAVLANAAAADRSAAPRIAYIRALMLAGRVPAARDEAVALARDNPGAPLAQLLAGDALMAAGAPLAAADAYRRSANIDFGEPVAIRLVDALRQGGRSVAAAQVLGLYLGQNPRNVPARLMAAAFMMSAGQFDRVVPLLEALRRDTGASDAMLLNNLAWAYARTRRMAAALPAAERAWRLIPANPALADSYGWMLVQSGVNRPRGLTLIEQAVAEMPASPSANRHLVAARALLAAR